PLGATGGVVLAALTFVAMAVLQWPLAAVLLAIGGAACAVTWRKLPA
ncbi:chromate transporter, partial [Acidovorax cattleyae]|nr:chromate transporter [Paracidovorax cattleyae]